MRKWSRARRGKLEKMPHARHLPVTGGHRDDAREKRASAY
jgi:hypothetical protein